tara:strand:- start:2342 stop:3565 length:1224 start_codon:yes stop_codon:yes gene_type:complete
MLIFAYEQKIDDFFIPNGLPPKVIDKMYRMRNPKDVFNNGCYQEDSGLVLPVYQCDTYTNLLYLKNIDFGNKLVGEIQEEDYYYLVVPFGTSNGFVGISKLQINYPFTNSISPKVIRDTKLGRCKILIDQWSEGHPFEKKWMLNIHKHLDKIGIPRKQVYYLTQNDRFQKDYENHFEDKNKINIKQLDASEIEIHETFTRGFDTNIHDTIEKNKDEFREKHFMSFNRGEKPHRTCLVNFLKDNDLLDKGLVSYAPQNLFLDTDFKKEDDAFNSVADSEWFESGNEYYLNSYFNIVTETFFYENTSRFSEKIFKPIIYKQPFVLYSTSHSLKKLRKMGYQTFDGFIDESYDEIEDNEKRLEMLNKEVQRLCNITIFEWSYAYKSMEEILNHNLNNFRFTTMKRSRIKI